MVFDVISFIVGVVAGLLTGALAGILHGLENTADLQERLRQITKQVQRLDNPSTLPAEQSQVKIDAEMEGLRRDLDEIHEEIRRMYRRSTR